MTVGSLCYLCDSEASIEIVKGEGGQRFDVECGGDCPRYEISQGAIDYLPKHPVHRKGAIGAIKQIAASGRFPVVRTIGIPKQLQCTSREAEREEDA